MLLGTNTTGNGAILGGLMSGSTLLLLVVSLVGPLLLMRHFLGARSTVRTLLARHLVLHMLSIALISSLRLLARTFLALALAVLFAVLFAFAALATLSFLTALAFVLFTVIFIIVHLDFVNKRVFSVIIERAAMPDSIKLVFRELVTELRSVPNVFMEIPWHPAEHLLDHFRLYREHLVNEINDLIKFHAEEESFPLTLG